MSFEIDREGWTPDEIAAGVHVAVALTNWEYDNPGHEFESCEEPSDFDWRDLFDHDGAALLISSISTAAEIRTRLSQYTLEREREQIAHRYSLRERLPAEFMAAALRSDALPILIKSFLGKVLNVYPAPKVNNEILELSADIRRNSDRRTAFERVGEIQKYLHRKTDEARGTGAHLDLPNKVMRHILSSSRLHIGLQDMFAVSTAYWTTIWDAETAASISEVASPNAGFIPDRKRRIRLWRVPQLKPITFYASRYARAVLQELGEISTNVSVDDYRTSALAALHAKTLSAGC